jgi:DNA polymerase V
MSSLIKTFALVDCNNFFVSCERVFNPSLCNKPVVVLSNNDGCIIARSNEAKSLGIPMGAPLHLHKHTITLHKVTVLSSNFQFYGDMSQRVMESLRLLVPEIEVYSIDEAFIRLDGISNLTDYLIMLNSKIRQWTGIPISIGVASTKVLAKIANYVAKKDLVNGIFDMRDPATQNLIIKDLPIEQIWGISYKWGNKFRSLGITTALELRESNPSYIRKHFSVIGERILWELREVSCLNLEKVKSRKNIISSRSFGRSISEADQIKEAIANYVAKACEKLRRQKSLAQGIYVYLKTNRFKKQEQQYSKGITLGFITPTDNTSIIIKIAHNCINQIYCSAYQYHKAGIILLDLILTSSAQQTNLFVKDDISLMNSKFMQTIDKINQNMGKRVLFFSAQGGIERPWHMRCNKRSPRYTTKWKELPTVK